MFYFCSRLIARDFLKMFLFRSHKLLQGITDIWLAHEAFSDETCAVSVGVELF
jgi:hypothetical protein